MDIEQARFNMIEQQIRPWEVLDPDVLKLLAEVKRERFVPRGQEDLAFADLELPLGEGEAMWQPKLEARVVQELDLAPADTVYELGTGSGYLTALLAHRTRHVTSAEIHPALAASAAATLRTERVANVTLLTGDSATAPLGELAYDVIVLTGSTPVVPQAFLDRLKPGGRLFAVLGDLPVMKATLFRQAGRGEFQRTELFETVLKPLVNAPQPARFRF
ncbi:protein-L-isoaspartate O-methyltransferase [Betaproteobacteria bacterium GR16-43]|nr:protein-L-isoaspartate O-methyltransferase [Betaproteobacteria bacterium GR16-43]